MNDSPQYLAFIIILLFGLDTLVLIPVSTDSARTSRDMIVLSDHHLSSVLDCSESTIIIEGDLTIEDNGLMNVSDSTLLMNPFQNGSSSIIVKNGGALVCKNSNISSNTSYGYNIQLLIGANCLIANSEVRNCGYYCVTPQQSQGFWSQTDNLTVENSLIIFEGAGISSEGGYTILANVTFIPNETFNDAKIAGWGPLYSIGSAGYRIENCTFLGVVGNESLNRTGLTSIGNHPSARLSAVSNSTFSRTMVFLGPANMTDCVISGKTFLSGMCRLVGPPVYIHSCTIINADSGGTGIDINSGYLCAINSSFVAGGNAMWIGSESAPSFHASVDLINCSYSGYKIENSLSVLNLSKFIEIEVVSAYDLSGIPNATVEIFDSDNKKMANLSTSTDGYTRLEPLSYKQITTGGEASHTPHRIEVRKSTFKASVTGIDMSQNRDIRVILDDVPPRLNVTNPPEGLVTNQTLIWVCGTTDVDARLTVDGSAVKNDNGTFNISYWLDEGNNTISVVAWDDSGNNKEVRCNVTCLTTPPMLQITEPSEMALTNHNPVTVRGKTNGTRLEVDATPVPISKSGDFTYSWNVSGEGKRTVTAIAWDIAGNSRMVKRTIIYDITPPAIEILSPQNGSWLRSETAEVRLRSPEAVMMNAGGISIDPDGTGLAEFRTALKEGANRVPISAWDAAGNENTTILILYLDTSIFLEVTEPHGDALINHSDVTFRGRTESGPP